MARLHIQPQPRLGTFTLAGAKPWIRTAGFWGVGAGAAVTLLMSVTPIFKKDVLLKVPVVSLMSSANNLAHYNLQSSTPCVEYAGGFSRQLSNYFEDTTPASDKPF
ncbi:hypothetical protein FRC08_014493 [Ceratobasidium sp. 394]|nr:hypothetical protein FRC08_014493 [Ceratobasidium sp. 394]